MASKATKYSVIGGIALFVLIIVIYILWSRKTDPAASVPDGLKNEVNHMRNEMKEGYKSYLDSKRSNDKREKQANLQKALSFFQQAYKRIEIDQKTPGGLYKYSLPDNKKETQTFIKDILNEADELSSKYAQKDIKEYKSKEKDEAISAYDKIYTYYKTASFYNEFINQQKEPLHAKSLQAVYYLADLHKSDKNIEEEKKLRQYIEKHMDTGNSKNLERLKELEEASKIDFDKIEIKDEDLKDEKN